MTNHRTNCCADLTASQNITTFITLTLDQYIQNPIYELKLITNLNLRTGRAFGPVGVSVRTSAFELDDL